MTEIAERSPVTPSPATAPRVARPLTMLTLLWLAGYAIARAVLVVVDPRMPLSAVGSDLLVVTGWSSVAMPMLAFAAVAVQAAAAHRPAAVLRWSAVVAGALAAASMMVSAALILLDLVGGILPGLGVVFFPLGTLIRTACVVAAALTAAHTWRFWSVTRPASVARRRPARTPAWVVAAGYAAVAACLTRLGAQLFVGMDRTPFAATPASVLFEIGFLLAGILLPLALVHRWGRIWPGWVPWLRGRRVPRMLLISCGGILSVTMIAYFGMMTVQMVVERMHGRNPFPPSGGLDLPEAFFWVSVPAYLIWGVGLAIGTISYARITAPGRTS
ncbi:MULTISPECIES: hypothetical protein [unclassified Microbacterium]|uniref:hypothetical protein n=1 Tax=unclassified Microbacterium TaxID=2609290 RepID=UPI0012FB3A04|nr:hypothetical protein [Microbacterium sp. MAH-37]MVQ41945.1 hypothetical protein [Microbacterium sp. MAH-37]